MKGFVKTRPVSGEMARKLEEIDPEAGESKEQVVTIESIDKRLEDLADLSTAEMIYTNLYTVTEGKIPFLTQKGFSMVYTANVGRGLIWLGCRCSWTIRRLPSPCRRRRSRC